MEIKHKLFLVSESVLNRVAGITAFSVVTQKYTVG